MKESELELEGILCGVGVGVGAGDLKIEESQSEVLCTDSTALVIENSLQNTWTAPLLQLTSFHNAEWTGIAHPHTLSSPEAGVAPRFGYP
jgi:hypothetical protein